MFCFCRSPSHTAEALMEKQRHVPAVPPPSASSHGRGQEQLPPMPCPIEMHRNIPVPAWGESSSCHSPFWWWGFRFWGLQHSRWPELLRSAVNSKEQQWEGRTTGVSSSSSATSSFARRRCRMSQGWGMHPACWKQGLNKPCSEQNKCYILSAVACSVFYFQEQTQPRCYAGKC